MSFWNKVGNLVGSIVEVAPEIMNSLHKEALKKQATMQKETERKINNHERNITQASKSNKMDDPNYARKVQEEKEKIEKAKVRLYTGETSPTNVKVNSTGSVTFDGSTVSQWNSRWISLGMLSSLSLENLSQYNKKIGLYKAEMNGQVVYLGRAIEYANGGFRKRLRDYVRESDSARTHGSGKKMHENANAIRLSILVVGDSQEDVDTVKALEKAMINHLDVRWNVQHNR
ncbi:hypothetical protein ACQKDD_14235 [Planococcus kocurii]|uniref:hypothetical protein n=1 Tax=Planococcus kocurii TaxID=1374 RepID=UPI003CFBEA1D